jgi:hypothetical protein
MILKLMSVALLIGLLTACPITDPIVEPASFQLSIDPSSVSIQQGGQLAITATVTRTGGFAGDVTLSFINPPIGVSANPVVVTKTESTGQLILLAGQTATAVGPISVSLQGLSAELNKVVPLSLKVTPAPIVNLNTKLDTAPTNAGMVAFQDGLGAWQVLNGANGNYSATVFDSAGRYSLAVVCLTSANAAKSVAIWQYTTVEHPFVQYDCEPLGFGFGLGVTFSATANISGLDAFTNKIELSMDGGTSFLDRTSSFTQTLISKTYDILAVEKTLNNTPIKYLIKRDLVIDQAHSQFDLDFTKAKTPDTAITTITGIEAGETTSFYNILDTKNNSLGINYGIGLGVGATFANSVCTFYNIVLADRSSSDLYFNVATSRTSSSRRSIQYSFKESTRTGLTLPGAINATVGVALTTPSVRLNASFNSVPNTNEWRFNIKQNSLSWSLKYSPGWLGFTGLLGYPNTVTMPELSGLPGWQATWGLVTGLPLSWEVRVTTSNRSRAELNRPGTAGTPNYNYATYLQVYDQAEFGYSSKNGLITP